MEVGYGWGRGPPPGRRAPAPSDGRSYPVTRACRKRQVAELREEYLLAGREKIRSHVRETLADPVDLEDEMALLFGTGRE